MRTGTKFILFLFAILAVLGAWLAWITVQALQERGGDRGGDARSAVEMHVC